MSISINNELVQSFEKAGCNLIDNVKNAVSEFYRNPPNDWNTWETWRTPLLWETVALVNLEQYQKMIKAAATSFQAGDNKAITLAAASYKGVSRDMDFDMRWMTKGSRNAVNDAVDHIAGIADRIHRLGHALLTAGSGET